MSTKKVYKEFHFTLEKPALFRDIFIAELAAKGFEGFTETPQGFMAYTDKEISPDFLKSKYPVSFSYEIKEILPQNWNKKWEEKITPLQIEDKVYIHTSFHEVKDFPYIIHIDPKMSFGTGHHETTWLMIKHMLEMNFEGKRVLDMGAGTGVLSILAEKMGAKEVVAIDIDEWAFENMQENFIVNKTQKTKALLGGAELLSGMLPFDIILANINLNILQEGIPSYIKALKKNGFLVLSGFLENDVEILNKQLLSFGMHFEEKKKKNQWHSLKFKKNT
jgi:ribosomal protein L11 methyltransferase